MQYLAQNRQKKKGTNNMIQKENKYQREQLNQVLL